MPTEIWPAIDLRGGKCVRLAQGDFTRETQYSSNPVDVAQEFAAAGAQFLHIVDLDGARTGAPEHLGVVGDIVAQVDMQCELGGGVRDDQALEKLLAVGLCRVVVGTAALKNPDWFRSACQKHPGKIVLGLDARNGFVATEGWLDESQTLATSLAENFKDVPMAAIIYTDIATDGMMTGPNIEAVLQMRDAASVPVIASGGVSSLDDIKALAARQVHGCIIGRALYEGAFRLEEALAAAE